MIRRIWIHARLIASLMQIAIVSTPSSQIMQATIDFATTWIVVRRRNDWLRVQGLSIMNVNWMKPKTSQVLCGARLMSAKVVAWARSGAVVSIIVASKTGVSCKAWTRRTTAFPSQWAVLTMLTTTSAGTVKSTWISICKLTTLITLSVRVTTRCSPTARFPVPKLVKPVAMAAFLTPLRMRPSFRGTLPTSRSTLTMRH